MKKAYAKPTAEKINFDYVESVVACPSGCQNPSHWDHLGYVYGSCGISGGNSGNPSGGQSGGQSGNQGSDQGGNQGTNSYWEGGGSGNSYWNP